MINNIQVSDQARVVRAWLVHLFTASGMLFALLAVIAIFQRDPVAVAVHMLIAMIIDGIDGIFARAWDVKKWAPGIDGRKMDDIIDYVTYTVVPVIFAYQFELFTTPWVWVLGLALIASMYCQTNTLAKTEDGFFTGFPSYWNGAIFYIFLMQPAPLLSGLIMIILGILSFVPWKYISFNQTVQFRPLTRVLLVIWLVMIVFLLIDYPNLNQILILTSLFFPVYYLGASFYLTVQTQKTS